MKIPTTRNLFATALVSVLALFINHAQAAGSPYKFERGFPTAGTVEAAYDASDLRRAIEAFKFFYGTVATEAVMQQGQAAGGKVNEIGIVMATSPRQQFGGANADTPYVIATVELKASGPMVVELPPGPFIGFVNHHNTECRRQSANQPSAPARFTGLPRATAQVHSSTAAIPTS